MLSEIRRERSSSMLVIGPRAYLQKRIDENEEGDELDRQAPGVDTKFAHTM